MKRKSTERAGKTTRILACLLILTLFFSQGICSCAETKIKTVSVYDCHYEPKTGEGYAGYAVHVHNADCFDSYCERVCELPVIPPHVHDASCYDSSGAVICGKLELHTHTDRCWKDGELICGKLELEEHIHGPK